MPRLSSYERQYRPDLRFNPPPVPKTLPVPTAFPSMPQLTAPRIPPPVLVPNSLAELTAAPYLAIGEGITRLTAGVTEGLKQMAIADAEKRDLQATTDATMLASDYERSLGALRDTMIRESTDPLTLRRDYELEALKLRGQKLNEIKDPLTQTYFLKQSARVLPGQIDVVGRHADAQFVTQEQGKSLLRFEDQTQVAEQDLDPERAAETMTNAIQEFRVTGGKVFTAEQVQTHVLRAQERVTRQQLTRTVLSNPTQFIEEIEAGQHTNLNAEQRQHYTQLAWSARNQFDQQKQHAYVEQQRQQAATSEELALDFEKRMRNGENVQGQLDAQSRQLGLSHYTRLSTLQAGFLKTEDKDKDYAHFNEAATNIDRGAIRTWKDFDTMVDPAKLSTNQYAQLSTKLRERIDKGMSQAEDLGKRRESIRDREITLGHTMLQSALRMPETAKFGAQEVEGLMAEAQMAYFERVRKEPDKDPFLISREVSGSFQRVYVDVVSGSIPFKTPQEVLDAHRLWQQTGGRQGIPLNLADAYLHYFTVRERLGLKPDQPVEKPSPATPRERTSTQAPRAAPNLRR
jgi:hypothetical protein